MSDSHTAYHQSFGACAFAGACTLGAALAAGFQARALAYAADWDRYNRDHLEKFLNLSELLREYQTRRADKAEAELRKLKLLALKRARRDLAPA